MSLRHWELVRLGFQPVASLQRELYMPDNTIWPPKPTLLNPLAEYDGLIKSKIDALSEVGQEPSRLLLMKSLRDEEGMSLRQAFAVVNYYCDRYGVLVRSKTTQLFAWSNFSLVLVAMALNFFNLYLSYRRDAILGLPHSHAASLAFHAEQLVISDTVAVLLFLNVIVLVIRFRHDRKK